MTGEKTAKLDFLTNATHQNMSHFTTSDHNERLHCIFTINNGCMLKALNFSWVPRHCISFQISSLVCRELGNSAMTPGCSVREVFLQIYGHNLSLMVL